ncbi:hypothetical protein SETIT_9G544300v2 [Setaria italica]|uniref:Uncharacterized protein n=1 Tax=Setaria italica TaxID=4555 RepID=A0A368SVZ0_SETIT|nr:hypothetical protein SETIT_9G544300v2 [Setaria italica]
MKIFGSRLLIRIQSRGVYVKHIWGLPVNIPRRRNDNRGEFLLPPATTASPVAMRAALALRLIHVPDRGLWILPRAGAPPLPGCVRRQPPSTSSPECSARSDPATIPWRPLQGGKGTKEAREPL